jgi:dihydrofolate reductase
LLHNISIIAAIDKCGLIGEHNHLPWKIREDLQHFRETTLGHPVVMGKKTWFSLGKPLDGRTNIILTHDLDFHVPGCQVAYSVEQILDECAGEDIFIIGGASVFQQFLPHATMIYLTRIDYEFWGDTFFPEVDWQQWEIISYERKATDQGYDLAFELWEKRLVPANQ